MNRTQEWSLVSVQQQEESLTKGIVKVLRESNTLVQYPIPLNFQNFL